MAESDAASGFLDASGAIATEMREARERAGMTLGDVASRTRVPLRHLEALEKGDLDALPGPTYVTGFGRAYARAVGLDETALVARLRSRMADTGQLSPGHYQIAEPIAPERLPPRTLTWIAGVIALLFAAGYGLWRMQVTVLPPAQDLAAPIPAETAAPARTVPPPALPATLSGPVVLTALDGIWLRIYQRDGRTLFERTMQKGETYTVPADARDPMILTGRPDALAVTVAGRPVPPLGTAERTIADVLLTPAALLSRGDDPTSPAAASEPETVTQSTTSTPAPPPAARTVRPARRGTGARTEPLANRPADMEQAAESSPSAVSPAAVPAQTTAADSNADAR